MYGKVTENYNLKICNPLVASEWNYSKNGMLVPYNFTPHSGKKVWWICINGHEWEAKIGDRSNNHNCPKCYGCIPSQEYNMGIQYPHLCITWDSEKNGSLTPYDVTPKSDRKVWWKCTCGHEWFARIADRTSGSGCPGCAGRVATSENNLVVKFPKVAQEWHPSKNGILTPHGVAPFSNKKAWWVCPKKHEYKANIYDRTRGHGCPKCFHRISKPGALWLDELGVLKREVPIKIGKKLYQVDGFDQKTNTIYEFFGDYWHGNPCKFVANDINPSCNKTYGQLFKQAMKRISTFSEYGFNVIFKWESSESIYMAATESND
jgi:hypothetical protein